MNGVAAFLIWLLLTIWASWFVARRVSERRTRVACHLLIWFVPIIGAATAVLILGFGNDLKSADSEDRMFDAVVDAHRKTEN